MLSTNHKLEQVKFKINRLGAITGSEVSLNQFMIFSGESGVGKSYTAIMCNYLFYTLWSGQRINKFFKDNGISFNDLRLTWKNSGEAFVITKEDLQNWMHRDIAEFLNYMLGAEVNADIDIDLPIPDKIVFAYNEELEGLVDAEDAYLRVSINKVLSYRTKNEDESIDGESSLASLLRYYLIRELFGNHTNYRYNFILPPSRGAVLTENVNPITGLYQSFKNMLDVINQIPPHQDDIDEHLRDEFRRILDGRVYRDGDKYYYETAGENMGISAAASSIKEIAPLSLFVNRFNVSLSNILIEEPEAHLHPLKQRMMADIIALLVNNSTCVQITTHSDYLLRRINELVMLFNISEKYQGVFEDLCERMEIPSYLKLDYHSIGAYLLRRRPDNTVEVICQNTENGVSFDTFYKALRVNIDNRRTLENVLDTGEYERS